ncbi:MAG: hypothetical protein Ct9H300mP32_5220 [Verrucomicrobiota bacterium]|nr:MAG: hypothetical protein Ct9H300mP32_5220 [Verrucomicrobiota bacterium]
MQGRCCATGLAKGLLNLVSVAVCLFVALSVLLPWPFAAGYAHLDGFLDAVRAGGQAIWNSFWYSAVTATLVPALGLWGRFAGPASPDLAAIFSAGRAVWGCC